MHACQIKSLWLCKKVFAACGGRIFFLNRRVFHDFAKQNHEKHVGLKLKFGVKRGRKNHIFPTTPPIATSLMN
jgi:hypothetical protein